MPPPPGRDISLQVGRIRVARPDFEKSRTVTKLVRQLFTLERPAVLRKIREGFDDAHTGRTAEVGISHSTLKTNSFKFSRELAGEPCADPSEADGAHVAQWRGFRSVFFFFFRPSY